MIPALRVPTIKLERQTLALRLNFHLFDKYLLFFYYSSIYELEMGDTQMKKYNPT